MPTPRLKRILSTIDKLYPPFLARYLDVLAACEKRGAFYDVTYGYRSFAEQAAIYFQGRTKPGAIVTNAGPGDSMHNYGLATDAVRDADLTKVGLQPEWDKKGYIVLREEAEKHGLQGGLYKSNGEWYDFGHVQPDLAKHAGKKEIVVLRELKRIHNAAPKGQELAAAWAHLDTFVKL